MLSGGAKLTDSTLTMRLGSTVLVPFARDCCEQPQFAVVREAGEPAWSSVDGLRAPVSGATWESLRHQRSQGMPRVTFVPAKSLASDGVEAVNIRAVRSGTYRLFAACPSAHYDSVGAAWLDIEINGRDAR